VECVDLIIILIPIPRSLFVILNLVLLWQYFSSFPFISILIFFYSYLSSWIFFLKIFFLIYFNLFLKFSTFVNLATASALKKSKKWTNMEFSAPGYYLLSINNVFYISTQTCNNRNLAFIYFFIVLWFDSFILLSFLWYIFIILNFTCKFF
jgi:hypothetical protein